MNFDEPIDRSGYPTLKWSPAYLTEHYGRADVIPMSVADMDLKAPPAVVEALVKRAEHGVYGYEQRPESVWSAWSGWYQARHGWRVERAQAVPSPSILSAVAVLIQQHSSEGDGVIVQPPVFFEFRQVVRQNRRTVVKNPLKYEGGRYRMDLEDLEQKAADPNNRVLILCNPHNPVGRVWTRQELEEVDRICERHGVFVIADEIHGDFAFPPHRYVPYLSVAASGHAAACLSPGKTFNVSGVVDAVTVLPDEEQRERFRTFVRRLHMNRTHVFANAAVEAAYRGGGAWLDALLKYLRGNVDLVRRRLDREDVGIELVEPEGTFLAWLDFRGLGLDAKELETFLAQNARVALAQGYWFGREGAGFARMTLGAPRSTVERAVDRIVRAVRQG